MASEQVRVEERQLRCARKLRAELGPAILSALDDPDVVEIIVNPPELGASFPMGPLGPGKGRLNGMTANTTDEEGIRTGSVGLGTTLGTSTPKAPFGLVLRSRKCLIFLYFGDLRDRPIALWSWKPGVRVPSPTPLFQVLTSLSSSLSRQVLGVRCAQAQTSGYGLRTVFSTS